MRSYTHHLRACWLSLKKGCKWTPKIKNLIYSTFQLKLNVELRRSTFHVANKMWKQASHVHRFLFHYTKTKVLFKVVLLSWEIVWHHGKKIDFIVFAQPRHVSASVSQHNDTWVMSAQEETFFYMRTRVVCFLMRTSSKKPEL